MCRIGTRGNFLYVAFDPEIALAGYLDRSTGRVRDGTTTRYGQLHASGQRQIKRWART
jgi:hypothetical protein